MTGTTYCSYTYTHLLDNDEGSCEMLREESQHWEVTGIGIVRVASRTISDVIDMSAYSTQMVIHTQDPSFPHRALSASTVLISCI